MLKRLKEMRDNKKGFTLVELIVVLVILAILAALLIPALTGYIDKAKEKQIVAETRQVVMAAQTLTDEQYAGITDGSAVEYDPTTTEPATRDSKKIYAFDILKLAEVKGTIEGVKFDSTDKGVVSEVTYKSNGKTCKYTQSDGQYKVTTP